MMQEQAEPLSKPISGDFNYLAPAAVAADASRLAVHFGPAVASNGIAPAFLRNFFAGYCYATNVLPAMWYCIAGSSTPINLPYKIIKTMKTSMTAPKQLIFALCLFWCTHASAHDQLKLSESRGGLLYSMHCNTCHTSEVHWRKQKLATDWNSLKAQVRRWQANIGLVWSEEETTDVTHYLNVAYYGFPATDQQGLSQDKKLNQVLRQ